MPSNRRPTSVPDRRARRGCRSTSPPYPDPGGGGLSPFHGSCHLALVGPTASGKSAAALELARRTAGIEIVSLDSMQVYRGMDIGTAKAAEQERAEVPHHLIDIADPSEEMTVARFQDEYRRVMAGIESRGARALLVGGTGLYVRACVDGLEIPGRYPLVRDELEEEPDSGLLHERLSQLDPVAASRIEPSNRRRVIRALEVTLGSGRPFSSFGPGLQKYTPAPFPMVGLRLRRATLDRRISERLRAQLDAGLVAEVRALAARPEGISRTARQALGYRELLRHVEGGMDLDLAVEEALVRIRRFARRQERWFRRDPRISWIDLSTDAPTGEEPAAVETDARQIVAELERRWRAWTGADRKILQTDR